MNDRTERRAEKHCHDRLNPSRQSLRIADFLQHVPMFYGLAIGVHLVDVNTGNPRVLRVVIE